MLNIGKFQVIDDILFYEGAENHYTIRKSEFCGYDLAVISLDGNGDDHAENFSCGSISIAIASIEALENGEEI